MTKTIDEMQNKIESTRTKAGWETGVKLYALGMLERLKSHHVTELSPESCEKELLEGYESWKEYSKPGNGIALKSRKKIEYLLAPDYSDYSRYIHDIDPTREESWYQRQERAIYQAYLMIKGCFPNVVWTEEESHKGYKQITTKEYLKELKSDPRRWNSIMEEGQHYLQVKGDLYDDDYEYEWYHYIDHFFTDIEIEYSILYGEVDEYGNINYSENFQEWRRENVDYADVYYLIVEEAKKINQ